MSVAVTMRSVLMIVFHYPPMAGSSGVQRTLRFTQHLPSFGWRPIVLSAHPRAYERTSDDLLKDIPREALVERAFALDAARHLSIKGRYLGALACPDRWISWALGAIPRGLALIRRYRPEVIWSTYPIASAHSIAATLQRMSGLPWIADFRDPMAQADYPTDPRVHAKYVEIERTAFDRAARCVFTAPGAADDYRGRYVAQAAKKVVVIENGYDEESFRAAEALSRGTIGRDDRPFTLLHSGAVYPHERDPRYFFEALAALRAEGVIHAGSFVVKFRGAVHDGEIMALASRSGIGDLLEFAPPMAYRDALSEMMSSDALLILQASSCNEQIPGKLYEYFRARRPILGLTDPRGDTARVLRSAGVTSTADLADTGAMCSVIRTFVTDIRSGRAQVATEGAIRAASREQRTAVLAEMLDEVTRCPDGRCARATVL